MGKQQVAEQVGTPPIMSAIQKGDLEIVKTLLAEGVKPNAKYRMKYGTKYRKGSPLLYAIQKGHLEIVKALSDAGAIINDYYYHPDLIHIATKKGHIEIVKELLIRGADPNSQRNCHKFTPVHIAVRTGNLEMVELLLKWKADPNAIDFDGYTPLNHIGFSKSLKIAEALLAAGADSTVISYKKIRRLDRRSVQKELEKSFSKEVLYEYRIFLADNLFSSIIVNYFKVHKLVPLDVIQPKFDNINKIVDDLTSDYQSKKTEVEKVKAIYSANEKFITILEELSQKPEIKEQPTLIKVLKYIAGILIGLSGLLIPFLFEGYRTKFFRSPTEHVLSSASRALKDYKNTIMKSNKEIELDDTDSKFKSFEVVSTAMTTASAQ